MWNLAIESNTNDNQCLIKKLKYMYNSQKYASLSKVTDSYTIVENL